jgi:hypothetical protein
MSDETKREDDGLDEASESAADIASDVNPSDVADSAPDVSTEGRNDDLAAVDVVQDAPDNAKSSKASPPIGWLLFTSVGAIAAAALTAWLVVNAVPVHQGPDPAPQLANLKTDLEGLRGRIFDLELNLKNIESNGVEALSQRLKALEEAPQTGDQSDSDESDGGRLRAALNMIVDIEDRIVVLEAGAVDGRPAENGARLDALESAIAESEIETRVDALERRLSDAATGRAVANLEARLKKIEKTFDPRAFRNATLSMAVASLTRAISGTAPFAAELSILQSLMPDDPDLAALEPIAAEGVATSAVLAADFAQMAQIAIRADRNANAQNWWTRLLANLQSIVAVRRTTDAEGDDVDAIIARIESHLRNDDIVASFEESSNLSDAAKSALAPWLAVAERRAQVERVVDSLNELILRAVATEKTPGHTDQ